MTSIESTASPHVRLDLAHRPSSSSRPSEMHFESRPPILVEWRDVKYDVEVGPRNARVKRHILKGISGFARPGEVVAIMGSSGAGKTTLLNYLADRVEKSNSAVGDGVVTLNGTPLTKKLVQKYFGYVMQEDFFFETLTTKELLYFYATMKLPATVAKSKRISRVDELIKQLGLTKCAESRIGGMDVKNRGLSGGEKKRLAIGAELITDPAVIFLDEPTTGLDSLTALNVVNTLRELAHEGKRTVICTIHQPSSEIFGLFDRLILLMNGHVIYQGPSMNAVHHFAKLGFQCPEFSNPADYFMMQVMQFDDSKEEDKARLARLIEGYRESQLEESKDNVPEGGLENELPKLQEASALKRENSVSQEMLLLMWRSAVNFFRQPLATRIRLGQNIFMSLIVGLLYLRIGNDQSTIADRQGVFFIIMMNNIFTALAATVLTFSVEKVVFLREHASGLYITSTYFWSKFISEYPIQLFFPLIYTSISYWLVGFQADGGKFFLFLITNILLVSCGQSIGMLIAAMAPNADVALAMMPVVIIPFILFSGLFLNPDNIPVFLKWLEAISPFKYAYNAMMIIEYTDLKLSCTSDQLFPPETGTCLVTRGEQILASRSVDEGDLARNELILVAVFAVTLFAAYGFLLYRTRK